jgi:hypothetical protein
MLSAFAARIARGELPSAELCAWFLTVVEAFESGVAIEIAFGLKPRRGERDPRRKSALARRDALLCEAARRFWLGSEVRASRELASALRLYEATAWRRERVLDELPLYRRGTVRELYWRILREWPQPISAGHIRRILGCARNAPFHAQAEM